MNPDIILLSLPSKVIDRPSLCLPVLTSYLRKKDCNVKQVDQNMIFNDFLLTATELYKLKNEILPLFLRLNLNNSIIYGKINQFLTTLNQIEENYSFKKLEQVKTLMQSREYENLTDKETLEIVESIFALNEYFYFYFILSVYYGKCLKENKIEESIYLETLKLIDDICTEQPKLVGLSIFERQVEFSLWFGEILGKNYSGKIVVGGSDPTLNMEKYLDNNKWIDYLIVGEGEDALYDLIKLENRTNQELSEIKNLIYRNNGAVIKNELYNKPICDFIIPDYEGFPLDQYIFNTFQIIATKGCLWSKCKFCMHWNSYGNDYSSRKVDHVVQEIKEITEKYGKSYFIFIDEALSPEFGNKLSKTLLKEKLDVRWMNMSRLDSEFNEKTFKTWYEGGNRVIEWGLETGSQKVMRDMRKGTDVNEVQRIIHESSRVGIINKMLMFYNYPTENLEDLVKSIQIIRKNAELRQLKPMLTLRHQFVLKEGSDLADVAFNTNRHEEYRENFHKTWKSKGVYEVNAKHVSVLRKDKEKKYMIDSYLHQMNKLIEDRSIFRTNNTNISMDLVLIDLKEQGKKLPVDIYQYYN